MVMASPASPTVTITWRGQHRLARAGAACSDMSPGLSLSKPSAKPNGALTTKWIHSTWAGVNGSPAAMLNKRRAEEGQHEDDQQHQDEADVLGQVVVDLAALLDGEHDGGEVVVGQDHPAGVLGHLGAGAHGDADVGRLDGRGVVDAVAGHGDDLALLLQRVGQQHLVLGGDPAHHADAVDAGQPLGLRQGGEVGAQDRLARRCRPAWRWPRR